MKIVIHKTPIKYDPMDHFRDIITERLRKIEKFCNLRNETSADTSDPGGDCACGCICDSRHQEASKPQLH